MVILVGGQKGGTGKSTLSICLAAYLAQHGHEVILVDANSDQGTAANWAARRDTVDGVNAVVCVEKSGNIHKSILALAEKYEYTIVDTGGQDSKELRTALPAADILITPVRPSQADLETLVHVADLVDQARDMNPDLSARVVITNAPANPKIQLLEEAKEALAGLQSIGLLKSVVYMRKSYMDALSSGLGVTEQTKDKKSAMEIAALAKELGIKRKIAKK